MTGFYTTELDPVLPVQPGVCQLCRGWSTTYRRCFECFGHASGFGRVETPVVLPLALSLKGTPLGKALRDYKDHSDAGVRQSERIRLRGLLSAMGERHESCLASAAGVTAFDMVACVPSSKRSVREHPLRLLATETPHLAGRVEDLLQPSGVHADHTWVEDRFVVSAPVAGGTVLLLDDTWTMGASVLSAALQLTRAGAAAVAVMAVGRHFNTNFKQSNIYLSEARRLGFDLTACSLCDMRPHAQPPLPARMRP